MRVCGLYCISAPMLASELVGKSSADMFSVCVCVFGSRHWMFVSRSCVCVFVVFCVCLVGCLWMCGYVSVCGWGCLCIFTSVSLHVCGECE